MTRKARAATAAVGILGLALMTSSPSFAQARWGHADQPLAKPSYGEAGSGYAYGNGFGDSGAYTYPGYGSYGYGSTWTGSYGWMPDRTLTPADRAYPRPYATPYDWRR